jgi:phospholipase C
MTFDDAGRRCDGGYLQRPDFVVAGPRIPRRVISRCAIGRHVNNTDAYDNSLVKFIAPNWKRPTISSRRCDELSISVATVADPYQPTESPAIGDLMDNCHCNHGSGGDGGQH